ncbi:MAG: efflux RND transporter periplasmic adaptor subunit [Bacillota bacterium]|nr:efflux RND transporter periplasmic adaptor subunit [Bacillota bacterium]
MRRFTGLVGAKLCAVAVVVLVLVVVAGGCRTQSALGTGAVQGAGTWATGTAARGNIKVTVTGSGALEPGASEEVRTAVTGTVRRVLVKEGDAVIAGQVLAELENEDVRLALEQARLNYDIESERLEEMRAGVSSGVSESQVRAAELKVETARLTLEARQKAVEDLTVRAAASGQVSKLDAGVGDDVSSGGTLLTILVGPYARVRVPVPEERIATVKAGIRASVILSPLPSVHMVKVSLGETSVYGLKVGDRVRGAVPGLWVPGQGLASEGTVTQIEQSGNLFVVTCRLPGLPADVLAGARVSVELYPSQRHDGVLAIYGGGSLYLATDDKGLELQHMAGLGHGASVISVNPQGVPDATGKASFEVTVQLDGYPEGALAGVSAHTCLFLPAGPYSATSVLETELRKQVTSAGGKVAMCFARAGDLVVQGQALMVLDNDTVRNQLEQARNDLAVQENSLRELTSPAYTAREILSQELKFRQVELALDARLRDAEALLVKAPGSGKVVSLNSAVVPGRSASTGTLLCRIANYDSMRVTIQVDELEVAQLRPGMPATVAVDALPGSTFAAQIASVSQEGVYQQGVSKFAVVLTVEGSPTLRSQMTATPTISVAEKRDVLLVPAEAVVFLGGERGEVTVVKNDGTTATQEVTIGLHNDASVEITAGLEAGAQVVTGVVGSGTNRGIGGSTIPGFTAPGQGQQITRPR